MNDSICIGSFDGPDKANSKVLAVKSSAPDEPMVHRLKRQMNCVNSHVQWKATTITPDEPTLGKCIASDHLMVLLSTPFSNG
jgi:hypothetical protein